LSKRRGCGSPGMAHVGGIVYSRSAIVPLDMPPVARDELCLRATTRHHPSTSQTQDPSQSPCKLTFVRVRELYTFRVGSSAKARGGDQAGCCAEVDIAMCDAFLSGKNAGLDVARLEFQRRTIPIRLRRNAGFGLGRTEII
jgi:hypothetical protein